MSDGDHICRGLEGAEGLASLVNAELKSVRSMETFRQVLSFRTAIEDPGLQKGWKTFAEVMTGKNFQWHQSQETHGACRFTPRTINNA